jgi:hypothetical protein
MIKKLFRDIVHNCIVHPMLPFLPTSMGEWLHRTNGQWAYPEEL